MHKVLINDVVVGYSKTISKDVHSLLKILGENDYKLSTIKLNDNKDLNNGYYQVEIDNIILSKNLVDLSEALKSYEMLSDLFEDNINDFSIYWVVENQKYKVL